MSTRRQLAAYREIQSKRLEQAQISAYGMVPIKAKFPGKCGCGRTLPADGHVRVKEAPCQFDRSYAIVKFGGAWWNTGCVDRVKQEEFQASARFVLEVHVVSARRGVDEWRGNRWTNDPKEAENWKECLEPDERVIDRISN